VPNLAVQSTFLPDLLRKTIAEIQSQTTKHVIKPRIFRPLPMVNIDRQKIEQLMTNLLFNAVKYSPQGGDIKVSIRQAKDKERLGEILGETSLIKPPCLIVTVTDHGIGIPEEDLERVFEKFYRVDNRLTRATSGAGLGLYICKIIVEAHGGHIWARSKVGEGSIFGLSLPVD
jgi:signal transduction histidine kinase